jgi:hypothetical protein
MKKASEKSEKQHNFGSNKEYHPKPKSVLYFFRMIPSAGFFKNREKSEEGRDAHPNQTYVHHSDSNKR